MPPPGFQGQIEIAVTARDPEGREVTAIFKFNVGQGAVVPTSADPPAPATLPVPAPNSRAIPPQGRSSFTDQIRQASRREGLLGWLRPVGTADLRGETGTATARQSVDGSSSALLQRIMASRTVQDGALQRTTEVRRDKAETAPAHPAGV